VSEQWSAERKSADPRNTSAVPSATYNRWVSMAPQFSAEYRALGYNRCMDPGAQTRMAT